MAKKKQEKVIVIQRLKKEFFTVDIVGEEPINIHKLGSKLAREFEERDRGNITKKKKPGPRDYDKEFMDSLYYIDKDCNEVDAPKKITAKTRFGFPASGFKKAMISACRNVPGVAMTEVKGRFYVLNRFVEIKGRPMKDKFWRRIGGKGPGTGTPDRGIRAVLPSWTATLYIKYYPDLISMDSVINLLHMAGQTEGIGEDRPNKQGNTFGMWFVK